MHYHLTQQRKNLCLLHVGTVVHQRPGLDGYVQQLEQEGNLLLGPDMRRLHRSIYLGAYCVRGIRIGDLTTLPQQREHREVRRHLAVRKALPYEIRHLATLHRAPEFCQEAGLTNAGFAGDPHHLTLPALGLCRTFVENGELVNTPDKRTARLGVPLRDSSTALDDIPHSVDLPRQWYHAARACIPDLSLHLLLHELVCGAANQYVMRCCRLLEAGG